MSHNPKGNGHVDFHPFKWFVRDGLESFLSGFSPVGRRMNQRWRRRFAGRRHLITVLFSFMQMKRKKGLGLVIYLSPHVSICCLALGSLFTMFSLACWPPTNGRSNGANMATRLGEEKLSIESLKKGEKERLVADWSRCYVKKKKWNEKGKKVGAKEGSQDE